VNKSRSHNWQLLWLIPNPRLIYRPLPQVMAAVDTVVSVVDTGAVETKAPITVIITATVALTRVPTTELKVTKETKGTTVNMDTNRATEGITTVEVRKDTMVVRVGTQRATEMADNTTEIVTTEVRVPSTPSTDTMVHIEKDTQPRDSVTPTTRTSTVRIINSMMTTTPEVTTPSMETMDNTTTRTTERNIMEDITTTVTTRTTMETKGTTKMDTIVTTMLAITQNTVIAPTMVTTNTTETKEVIIPNPVMEAVIIITNIMVAISDMAGMAEVAKEAKEAMEVVAEATKP